MKMIDLVKISRPVLWFMFPLIFFIGLAISGARLSPSTAFVMFLLTFPACFFVYGINDIYDYKSDKINPRKKSVEGQVVSPKYSKFIKKISFFMAGILILSIVFTSNLVSAGIVIIFLFASYFYSAPPLRLKEKPPFDSLSNGFIYWFLPFSLGFSFSGGFAGFPLVKILWLLLGTTAAHAITTMVDFSADKKVGFTTFAIRFGKRNTALFIFLSFLCIFLFGNFLTLVVNVFLLYSIIISFLLVIFPTEKFSKLAAILILIAFIIATLLFLVGVS